MDALPNSFCPVLLMALVTRVALLHWRERRGRDVSPEWWRPVARAFSGAGVFLVLALSYWEILLSTPGRVLWHFIPNLPIGEPGGMTSAVLFGFPLGCAGVVTVFSEICRPSRGSLSDGRKPSSRLAKATLLVGLAAALWIPWNLLFYVAPDLLYALGSKRWEGYLTHWGLPPRSEVAVGGLNLFAEVTLLLWLFQHLWGRAVQEVSGHRPSPTPP